MQQLRQSFVETIPASRTSAAAAEETADGIRETLVSAFPDSQSGHLTSSYLLVWADPVDFLLTDAQARQAGNMAAVRIATIGFLRLTGATNFAEPIRRNASHVGELFTNLNILETVRSPAHLLALADVRRAFGRFLAEGA